MTSSNVPVGSARIVQCSHPPATYLSAPERAGGRQAAHLGERRDPDAQLDRVAGRATLGLLRAERVVAEHLQGPRGRGLVVAGVVREPGDLRVGELVVRDPVLAAHLQRLYAELGRHLVDDPLDGVRRLGPPGSAVRVGGRLRRVDAGAGEVERLHLVDARVHEHAEQRCAGSDDLQVGAHVGEEVDLHPDERAVAHDGHLDVLDLVAPVVRRHHVLAAGLRPLHRAAELLGQHDREDLLAVDLQLGAESATDVGSHDPEVVLRDAGEQGQEHAQDVRDLGGRPDGDLVAHAHRCRDDRARLHRVGDQALVDEAALHDDVGLRLRGLVVAARHPRGVAAVRALVGVDEGRAVLERVLHVDHGGQRLVVDVDEVERVGRERHVGGQHHGDDIAGVLDLVHADRGVVAHDDVVGDRPHARGAGQLGEVGAGVDGHDAVGREGGRGVDVRDPGVGHGAAQHGHVQRAGQLDVVGPVGATGEETRVLLAADRSPDSARGDLDGVRHDVSPLISAAAMATALTMLW